MIYVITSSIVRDQQRQLCVVAVPYILMFMQPINMLPVIKSTGKMCFTISK